MKKTAFIALALLFLVSCTGADLNKEKEEKQEKQEDVLLGSFETEILDKDEGRIKNLNISAGAIDGVIIEQGNTFSFNDVVGRRTREKGYEEAAILVGCEKDYAVGGGVCQVSSTLYKAALAAGLEIVERHSHSADIHYLPKGQDAAISFGTLDFKFKNNLDGNIKIAVSTDNNKVYASIWKTGDK